MLTEHVQAAGGAGGGARVDAEALHCPACAAAGALGAALGGRPQVRGPAAAAGGRPSAGARAGALRRGRPPQAPAGSMPENSRRPRRRGRPHYGTPHVAWYVTS